MLCAIVNSYVQHCARTGNSAPRGFAFKALAFRLIWAFLFFTIPCGPVCGPVGAKESGGRAPFVKEAFPSCRSRNHWNHLHASLIPFLFRNEEYGGFTNIVRSYILSHSFLIKALKPRIHKYPPIMWHFHSPLISSAVMTSSILVALCAQKSAT